MQTDDAVTTDGVAACNRDAAEASLAREFRCVLRDPAASAAFAETVRVYTALLRTQGEPIERIIMHLKEVLRAAPFVSARHVKEAHDVVRVERIMTAAVLRCIEHYYDAPLTKFSGV